MTGADGFMAPSSRLSPTFLRFLAVGVGNTLVGYALYAAFLAAGASIVIAVVAATALGALFNFGSIGVIVFRNADPLLLPRFLAVYVAQCAVNSAALWLLGGLGLGPYLAQFILLPFLATGTFLAMRSWVFRVAPASN